MPYQTTPERQEQRLAALRTRLWRGGHGSKAKREACRLLATLEALARDLQPAPSNLHDKKDKRNGESAVR